MAGTPLTRADSPLPPAMRWSGGSTLRHLSRFQRLRSLCSGKLIEGKLLYKSLIFIRKLMDGKGGMIYNNYRSPQPLNGREVKVIKRGSRRRTNGKGSKKKSSKLM